MWRNRIEGRGMKLMEGLLAPIDMGGNSPGPLLKPLAKALLVPLREGNNESMQREFRRSWPGFLHKEVNVQRTAVIREVILVFF